MKYILILLMCLFNALQARAAVFSVGYDNGRVVRSAPEGSRPVVGIALSGGGARGIAHIGVLEVLEEKGVRVDRIAGTSMGSIIGGLYAAGYSTRALTDIITNIDWPAVFSSGPERRNTYIGEKETSEWPLFELRFEGFRAQLPSSLTSGQRISSLLSWLTLSPTYECNRDFDKLKIPFRAISTDLKSDSTVTIGSGNLGRAIQASSTIPLLFSPVKMDGMLLVDGGLKNNLPVDAARAEGSDFVIAVAIDESMYPPEDLDNPLYIADQSTSIMMRNITRLSKKNADFLIEPDMESFSSRNYTDFQDMIERGREAARKAFPALADSIKRMSASSPKATIRHLFISPPVEQNTAEAIVRRHIGNSPVISYAAVAQALDDLWSTGKYSSVTAKLDESSAVLEILLAPAPATVLIRLDYSEPSKNIMPRYRFSSLKYGVPDMPTAIARVDSLIRSLRSDGYSLAYIKTTDFDVVENELVVDVTIPKITKISIADGLKSRESLVMREFETEVGEVFDLKRIMNTVDNLYGTNLYQYATIDVVRYDDGAGLVVNLIEKNWTVARFGLRYDEFFNSEGRITLTRENIMGFGNKLIMTGHTGRRRQLLMIENTNPRIYKTLYTFNLKTYRSMRLRPVYQRQSTEYEYRDERLGMIVSAGQQMDKLGNAMLEFKTETIRTRYAPSVKIKNAKKEFRSIVFRSIIDSYDRYPFPKSGFMNIMYLESATEVLGGSEEFVKMFWSSSAYMTLGKKHTVSGSFSLGTSDPSTPLIDAFTLGGDATRLNCYDSASSRSHFYADFAGLSHEERRGTRLATAKLNYRLFIPRAFYLDLTYSAGNVWNSKDTISANTMLQSYGVKGSFATYFGPLSVGWGITSQGDDRVYLSGGWDF